MKSFLDKGASLVNLSQYQPKVALTLGQNSWRNLVVCLLKKHFFIFQMAKSMVYYAA